MDAIIGIFNNPLVLAAIGFAIKFAPGVRGLISNRAIPFINILLAWLSTVVAPIAAHAAGGPLVVGGAVLGFLGLGGPLGGIGAAAWQAAQAWILNEMLAKHVSPARPADSKR